MLEIYNTLMSLDFSHPPNFNELEEKVLEFWDKDSTFQKSIDQRPADKSYVFYDGPPFATGLPHYGHLLASTIKDVIPRYKTMKGYRVERRWGWDCHGLPIENMIEGELKLKGGKKGIEELGIGNFNDSCRSAILRFDKEWEKIIRRIGRWVDFKNSYKTMDKNYMESVWWGFGQMYQKNLIYQGRKIVLYCPRCATPLSNFEIAMDNSYKDVEDNSVYVKFKLKKSTVQNSNSPESDSSSSSTSSEVALNDKSEYLLAWTTTPWTLPGNVGLAVQADADYSLFESGDQLFWAAKDRLAHLATLINIKKPNILKTVKGSELVGLEYESLYQYMPLDGKKAHYVLAADFVSLEDGTGIVHTAAIYGEDDYALAVKADLPCVPTLDDEGKFLKFVTPLAGVFYKKSEDWIVSDLQERDLLFHKEKYTHSYPFCYRCSTPLYYSAVPAWFINIAKLKSELIKANQSINWFPEHLKHGRFGKGLETAPDWNISRSRYWGTPMPIWSDGEKVRIITSIDELKKWAVDPSKVAALSDIHRENIDEIEVWIDDSKKIKGKRIKEVFDCWVESASMPFAAMHYPFENKEVFEKNYPAQFISEYIAQTRAWFYCMHVISVGIFDRPAYQNALTTGTILAEDGTKMSKSKKNYPDPMLLVQKHGVDSLRLYLMSSIVMKGDNLNFSEKEVGELRKNVFMIWWNVLSFYHQYALKPQDPLQQPTGVTNILDKWILSRLTQTTIEVTKNLDNYDVVRSSRSLMEFLSELSTWYLRSSRERIKSIDEVDGREEETAQLAAISGHVLGFVLSTLSQLFAPLTPFFAEASTHSLCGDGESVHLSSWPVLPKEWRDEVLEKEMTLVRNMAEVGHSQRKEKGIKVRQPLASITVTASLGLSSESQQVLQKELNLHQVISVVKTIDTPTVVLDFALTDELKQEGEAREIIRSIQSLRREKLVDVQAIINIALPSWPSKWESMIKKKTKVGIISKGEVLKIV